MKTADKIKNLRSNRHLTQKELAKLAGLGEITICKYEADERIPKKEQLQQLVKALGVKINSLLFILDDVIGLSFDGERQSDGQLIPEIISIKLNNNRVNEVVSDWEIVHQEYLDDFDKTLLAIKEGKSMGVDGLMDIIAEAEVPLQGEINDEKQFNKNNIYEQRIIGEIENIEKGAFSKIAHLDNMDAAVSLAILKTLISFACTPTTVAYILFSLNLIHNFPEYWLVEHLPTVVEEILNIEDEWEFRRLLECIEHIPTLIDYYISLGLKSINVEVIEAANDFKQKIVSSY